MMKQETSIETLQQLGFTQYEAQCYLGLLRQHPLNGSQLSTICGVPRSMVYQTLGRLEEKAAVVRLQGEEREPQLYEPVAPRQVIAHLSSEAAYKRVPAEQKERLRAFRSTHPRKQIEISGIAWSYLLSGQGTETLLILPGSERIGDVAFPLMQQFEPEYRCLYPSYSPFSTMGALVDGLAVLLDRLSITQVILFAASFGGDVGQCFVRKHPDRVGKLVLLNTGIPDKHLGKATQRLKPLVTLLPLRLVRSLVSALLVKALSVRPEEQLFWQSMMHELVGHLTRADMVSSFDETIDYRLNYHFSPADLTIWPGNVFILQSDDDPATKPAMRQALRDLYPQAQVHTFHQAGHTPFLSQPDEFYPRVRAFFRQL